MSDSFVNTVGAAIEQKRTLGAGLKGSDILLSKTIASIDQSIVRIDSMSHGVIAFDDLLNGPRPRPTDETKKAGGHGIHSTAAELELSVTRLESALRILINGKD